MFRSFEQEAKENTMQNTVNNAIRLSFIGISLQTKKVRPRKNAPKKYALKVATLLPISRKSIQKRETIPFTESIPSYEIKYKI